MLEEQIEKHFTIPIQHISDTHSTPKNLISDLELDKTHLDVDNKTVYEFLFKPKTIFGKSGIRNWINTYTTNADFLKDQQKVISKFSNYDINVKTVNKAWDSFKNIKEDTNFIDKFQYIGLEKLEFLNKSTIFLSVLSMYSIVSPILNLVAPLLLLLIPFVLLRFKKIPITLSSYFKILMVSIKNHSFGKLITQWSHLPWSQRIYLLLMAGMYVYNIYQNAISCYSFYKNSHTINKDIKNIKEHLHQTSNAINKFIGEVKTYKTYNPYVKYLQGKNNIIDNLLSELNNVPIASFNPQKIPYIGYTMKQYYLLYQSKEITEILLFSFGFQGLLENLHEISKLYKCNVLNNCKILNKKKPKLTMKKAYYPTMISDKVIPNDISLNKNKLITGPNASGKTTLLKTVTTNLLLTQQFGMGFYSGASVTPFNHIHCYLNIPDTSSRDSLFQAEARRCLDILNSIENNKKEKHFCIFDELFSGTNPYEAVSSALAYLQYISEVKNVRFMLTTHFIQLCEKLEVNKSIENINMHTIIKNNVPTYKYSICNGISNIKGGITVLKELGYPPELIKRTEEIIYNL